MRVIIVEDKDAKALLDSLELHAMKESNILVQQFLSRDEVATAQTVAEVHRAFHYVVVNWLQGQGFNVMR